MKSFKFLSLPVLLLSTGIFFSSCKKDSAGTPTCKIITVSASAGDGYNFTYNSDGKIETVTYGATLTVYTYSGNTTVASTTNNGAFAGKKTITLNANGFAASVKSETSANGSTWYKDTYEYNGAELLKDTYTNSQNVAPQVTTAAWSGGNMISTTQSGTTTTIEYDLTKPAREGDYIWLIQTIQGYKVYSTKNPIKSVATGNSITSFDYTFENGKITALKFNGGSITTYSYQYQCK
ncbi:MAG: hypothetical protein ABIP30_00190 [Ferruginibacter sp.]